MKKRFAAFVLAVCVAATPAAGPVEAMDLPAAQTAEESGWNYEERQDGTLDIMGCNMEGSELVVPETIDGKVVRGIGDYAFDICVSATRIVIPASVTEISRYAFSGCENLEEIEVGSENSAYQSVNGVLYEKTGKKMLCCPQGKKTCVVPDGVTEIGDRALQGCSVLTEIGLPASLTTIGADAFQSCYNLAEISLPSGVTEIGAGAFQNCGSLVKMELPSGVKAIGECAFMNCNSLANMELPSGTTVIGGGTFQNCSSLAKIGIPASVTEIGGDAFRGCGSLTEIKFPENLAKIGDRAFLGCEKLTAIELPDRLEQIGKLVFKNCARLTEIKVGSQNRFYRSVDGVVTSLSGDKIICYPEGKRNLVIPEGVTGIESEIFDGDTRLTEIGLPQSLKRIGENAFGYCTGLIQIVIPDGVTQIGRFAFYGCSSLKNVKLPNGLTSLEALVFSGCSGLETIEIPASVTQIDPEAFGAPDDETSCDFSKVTIIGQAGSAAERFAAEHGFRFQVRREEHTHQYDGGKITQAATCTVDGVRTYTCACGASYTEPVKAAGHSYGVTTVKATTKKNGSVTEACTVCGEKKSSQTISYPKKISLSKSTYDYDGRAKKPSVTVTDSSGAKISSGSYTVSYSGNKKVGQATVTVKFKGNYSGTLKQTFTIRPKGTNLTKLTPARKGFTVKWKKQTSQTSGYEISYSTNSRFTKKTTKTIDVKKNSTTSKKSPKLPAGKKYYVRVRTYRNVRVNGKTKKIYSGWSKVKTVKTKK